jgi:hypothetical protein
MSGMSLCIAVWVMSGVLKNHTAFIFCIKQSKKTPDSECRSVKGFLHGTTTCRFLLLTFLTVALLRLGMACEHPLFRLGIACEHPLFRLGIAYEHPLFRLGMACEHPLFQCVSYTWLFITVNTKTVTTKAWVWSQGGPCKICGGQSNKGLQFCWSTSATPPALQHHSINPPYSFIHVLVHQTIHPSNHSPSTRYNFSK